MTQTRSGELSVVDLGTMGYAPAWEIQRNAFRCRELGLLGDTLLFAEHPPVYTFGRKSDEAHLLAGTEELRRAHAEVYHVERGGDVTFHGPGQVVGYPILDLRLHYEDLHRYLRELEETIIRTIARFGVAGTRDEQYTGVWVRDEKIAAIGVKVRSWITMHGFALNVNTDLSYFNRIIPCGIFHKGVTSLSRILGNELDCGEVRELVAEEFATIFHQRLLRIPRQTFLAHLTAITPETHVWTHAEERQTA